MTIQKNKPIRIKTRVTKGK